MDAIIIAGGIPQPDEPLYEFTQGRPKALLDIAGKPMIQWVLDALNGSQLIDRIVLVGLSVEDGLKSDKPLSYVPNQGGMLQNLRAGIQRVLELNPQVNHVLTVSSDIPAITPEIIDWLIDRTSGTDYDVYYTVIPRQVMEARYPNSKRSYTRLKDIEVCGGDMNKIHARLTTSHEDLWEKILAARKSPLKQASLLGIDNLILLLLGRITLEKAVERVTKRMNLTGEAVISPYAELGMDVDKPHQLEIIRADLARIVAGGS
jgi:GTP:adenosylcobinamide-phosphate guanylyltransferase